MAELGQNEIVELTALKVQMATMQSDMRHLAETMERLQRTLENASPRGEVAALEKRHLESEARLEGRLKGLEGVVGSLKDAFEQGKGAGRMGLILNNVFWALLGFGYMIWSNSK